MYVVKYEGGDTPMIRGPYYFPHEKWGSPWTTSLISAKIFDTVEGAESAILLFAVRQPHYIGELEVAGVEITKDAWGSSIWKEGCKEEKREAHAIH